MTDRNYTVTLADGTILEGSCGLSGKALWCWISGRTMADCFALFSDPEKTKEITMRYTVSGILYKGFTEFEQMKKGTDVFGRETVDIQLTWPEGGEHSAEEFPITRGEGGTD